MAKAIGTFPYYGGKQRLCKSIAEFIPQGVASITDACGGSGKLILNCRYAPEMVYNDLNPEMAALMTCIKDRHLFGEFLKQVETGGYSKTTFERARVVLAAQRTGAASYTMLELGVAKYQALCMSFNSTMESYAEPDEKKLRSYRERLYGSLQDAHFHMEDYDIQVTCRDAIDIMAESGPEDMVLLDVPYLAGAEEERHKTGAYGAYDWGRDLHEKFLDRANQTAGKVLICGYESRLYAERLSPDRWLKVDLGEVAKVSARSKLGESKPRVHEIVWVNYEPPAKVIRKFTNSQFSKNA